MPTEQQLKDLCDLITAGVGARADAQKTRDLEAQLQQATLDNARQTAAIQGLSQMRDDAVRQ